ncbi:MAG: hypothetical protein ABIH41_03065, partial [Nanoarchaeota archaeon]
MRPHLPIILISILITTAIAAATPGDVLVTSSASAAGDHFGTSLCARTTTWTVGSPAAGGSHGAGKTQTINAATGLAINPTKVGQSLDDSFGYSVDCQNDNFLVGAYWWNNPSNIRTGRAYLFGPTGTLIKNLDDPDPHNNDYFGESVAFSDSRILVGEPGYYYTKKVKGNIVAVEIGKIHIYDLSGNDLLEVQNPNLDGLAFGEWATAYGDRALVTTLDNVNGVDRAGSVLLIDTTTGALLHTFLPPTPTMTGFFGAGLTMDDRNIVIGELNGISGGTAGGAAYLYDATTYALITTIP